MLYCDSDHIFDFYMPYVGKWERHESSIVELAKDKSQREATLAAVSYDTVNVIVVGSGGAGFSAYVAAHDKDT